GESAAENLGDRHRLVAGAQRNAVDAGQFGERRTRLDDELAEEARVVRPLARFAEQAVEQPNVVGRGDDIDLVARLRPAGMVRAERASVADKQRRPRPARNALAPRDRTVGMDHVTDDLVIAAPGQFQLDAVDHPGSRRDDEAEVAGDRPDRPALHDKGDEDDDEGGVEQVLRARNTTDDRDDAEQDRYGTAEADPRDERHLPAIEAERQEADPDRHRAGDEREEQGEADRRPDDAGKLRGRRQQAERQEHGDLAQPGRTVLETAERGGVAHAGIARHDAGGIGRYEAAAAEEAGESPERQRHRDHHDRVERGLEVRPV